MQRAGQAPHGARPNREEAWLRSGACRLGAPNLRVGRLSRAVMHGPEEWPSCWSNPADRIRLTGPAATTFVFNHLHNTTSRCDAGVTRLLGQQQRYWEAGTRVSCFGRNNPLITARQRNNPGRASRQGRYRDQSRKRGHLLLYCLSSSLLPLIRSRSGA